MALDVRRSPELQATLLAIKRASTDVRKVIYANARRDLLPMWQQGLARRTTTELERRVLLRGARVRVSPNGFEVKTATSRRALSQGLTPAIDWPAIEFGARNYRARYRRRNPGGSGSHLVTRTLNRQFAGRTKHGRIAFETASEIGTAFAGSAVVSIVNSFRDAAGDERS